MKINYFLLFLILINISCSSNGDDNPADNGFNYVGIWELTNLEMSIAQDMNGDGIFSTNLKDELVCFQTTIDVKNDKSFVVTETKLKYISNTETTVVYECNGSSSGSGTWSEVENGIKIGNITYPRSGNQLTSNIGDEIPGFLKVVYTKL